MHHILPPVRGGALGRFCVVVLARGIRDRQPERGEHVARHPFVAERLGVSLTHEPLTAGPVTSATFDRGVQVGQWVTYDENGVPYKVTQVKDSGPRR